VIDRLAIDHRPCPGGVVGDHPADGGAAGAGNIRREAQALCRQGRVQIIEHDAGLDAGPALLDVHLEQAIEILRRIDDESRADGLSRLRRAAATHRQ
jgi:hypothetical protein